jgi:hypothetical protein
MKNVSASVSVPEWHRCGSLILAASLWALSAAAQAQTKPASAPVTASVSASASASATSPTTPLAASGAAKPTVAGSYREITWEDLVPKDWDPTKEFKQANIGLMKDGDPRATEMLKRMREAWNNAPTNNELDGVAVRLPGYLVPLDESGNGIKEFLLVPYFGACIHTPPPPANQIILVQPQKPAKGYRSMDTVWISGTLKALRGDSYMGASGYRMDSAIVEPYVGGKK